MQPPGPARASGQTPELPVAGVEATADRGSNSDASEAPLGILAGGGSFPTEIAQALASRGRRVHIVGLRGEADAAIEGYPHTWVHWGGIGALLRAFRVNGCRELVIVGRVRRPNLSSLRPDLGFWTTLPALLGVLRGGDDAILRTVMRIFERHGITVVGAQDAAPEILVGTGLLGRHAPAPSDFATIAKAVAALASVGPFDAAQAAVAQGGKLIALEGADGTDAMLQRVAQLSRRQASSARMVLVKLPKTHQERRVDLPAIGPETIRRAAEAGISGLAVGGAATLIAQRQETVGLADDMGLFLLGVETKPRTSVEPVSLGAQTSGVDNLKPIGRWSPGPTAKADGRLAGVVLAALEPGWDGGSVLVSRGYVLATEPSGGAMAAVERAGRLKPWGARLLRRKVGVLVMSDIAGELGYEPGLMAERAQASGLSGLAVLRSPTDEAALAALATAADSAGLFLLAPGRAL